MMKTSTKQKTSRVHDEHLLVLRQVLEELRGLHLKLDAKPQPAGIDWDHLSEEEPIAFKPGFLRKLAKARTEIKQGKVRPFSELLDA